MDIQAEQAKRNSMPVLRSMAALYSLYTLTSEPAEYYNNKIENYKNT